jgi:CDP-paratose 2-epimerase
LEVTGLKSMVITGGMGFVGSHVAEHFAESHRVVICDNFSREEIGKFAGQRSYNRNYLNRKYPILRFQRLDVRDSHAIRETCEGAEVIIHTAGQVAVTNSLLDPRTDFETNALGTFNILEAARLNDSAVVFCSTNKVYGENVNGIPIEEEEKRYKFANHAFRNGIPEDFPIDRTGHSPYGSSKLAADIYVQDYAHTYGLKTGVFRMSCIYGERQFGVEDQGWLAWFTIATVTGKPLTIYGNGKQVRDILYVEDLVNAFDRFLQSSIKHEVFNIGGGPNNSVSLLELLDLLRNLIGKHPHVSFSDWRASDQRVYISDIRKAQRVLGWGPIVPLRAGLLRVINWVKENAPAFAETTRGLSPTPVSSI